MKKYLSFNENMKYNNYHMNLESFIGNLLKNKLFKSTLIILSIIPAIVAVFYAPINPDSGYYLASVERIADGGIPYVDFAFGYTPLVIYIFYVLKTVFFIGINYEFYLIVFFLFQYSSAFLVYLITKELIQNKNYSFYAAILFLFASHHNDGYYVLLETPSLFFGLFALYLALKNTKKDYVYFIIGLMSSFAFLSKQYGLGFVFLSSFILLFNKVGIKKMFLFFLSFLLPIVFCFFIWGTSFLSLIMGNGYTTEPFVLEKLTMLSQKTIHLFVFIFPALFVAILYAFIVIIRGGDKSQFRDFSFLLMAIFGFLLQFFFAPFKHYFLYIIPFACILLFYVLEEIKMDGKMRIAYITLLLVTTMLNVTSTYYGRVYKKYIKRSYMKEMDYQIANKLNEILEKGQTLYIGDGPLIFQYYLTDMQPPQIKKYGYGFGPGVSDGEYLERIEQSDFILKLRNESVVDIPQVKNQISEKKSLEVTKDVILIYNK